MKKNDGTYIPESGTSKPSQATLFSAPIDPGSAGNGNTNRPEKGTMDLPGTHFGVDWGYNGKNCCVNGRPLGLGSDGHAALLDFIRANPGTELAIEENFFCYSPADHNEVMDVAAENHVTLLCTHTNAVKNFRKDNARESQNTASLKKDDKNDSDMLYLMRIQRPGAFKPPKRLKEKPKTTADGKLVEARRAKYSEQNEFIKEWLPYCNLLAEMPWDEASIIRNAGKEPYLKFSLIALALQCETRKEFDKHWCARRTRGLVASNFYFHWIKGNCADVNDYAERKEKMRLARRAFRRFYALIKERQKAGGGW